MLEHGRCGGPDGAVDRAYRGEGQGRGRAATAAGGPCWRNPEFDSLLYLSTWTAALRRTEGKWTRERRTMFRIPCSGREFPPVSNGEVGWEIRLAILTALSDGVIGVLGERLALRSGCSWRGDSGQSPSVERGVDASCREVRRERTEILRRVGSSILVGMPTGENRGAERVSRTAASDFQARPNSHLGHLEGLFGAGSGAVPVYRETHHL